VGVFKAAIVDHPVVSTIADLGHASEQACSFKGLNRPINGGKVHPFTEFIFSEHSMQFPRREVTIALLYF
jgi:hypothetical protein